MSNQIFKWCFFAYTLSIFCAIWPGIEQPVVQAIAFQTGGIILWAVASICQPIRRGPREHLFFIGIFFAFACLKWGNDSLFSLSQVFLASIVYLILCEKIEKAWIIDSLFIASMLQLPVALGQIFGYDPIFNYRISPLAKFLAHQATGFIGGRSMLCIFLAVASMLFLEQKRLLYGLLLTAMVFFFRGIAGMGGIMLSWLVWARKRGRYVFLAILLASACVLAPQVQYIIQTKSTIRLMVWKEFFDASFSSIYVGHGLLSVKRLLPMFKLSGWETVWRDIHNSYLTIFFEMGIVGLFMLGIIFRKASKLYFFDRIPVSFYAFLVLAFSSFFQTTHIYPSIAYLWILVLALIHIDLTEKEKENI